MTAASPEPNILNFQVEHRWFSIVFRSVSVTVDPDAAQLQHNGIVTSWHSPPLTVTLGVEVILACVVLLLCIGVLSPSSIVSLKTHASLRTAAKMPDLGFNCRAERDKWRAGGIVHSE